MTNINNVAIIGGSGKMGQWFARFLTQEGKEVTLIGRNLAKLEEVKSKLDVSVSTHVDDIRLADAVIISVPVDYFEETVKQMGTHTLHHQLIFDVTSIKTLPVEMMHRYIVKGQILGTHPVFGPGARSLANQNFVLTPTTPEETKLAHKVEDFLKIREAKVQVMTPEEHDSMMSVILGLAHFIAIVSADSLSGLEQLKKMESIGGITYKVLWTLVESVISEDPGLYASLQMNLPQLPQIQQLFLKNCTEWTELVKNKDRQEFIRRMKAIRSQLEAKSADFGKAYDNMYKIAEGL
ncbi:MAG: prephenate dehydrogenase [Dehalococcoidales bacterium]|nr:prephenate dehydrogenase [Dehalococcoidales bacterium]